MIVFFYIFYFGDGEIFSGTKMVYDDNYFLSRTKSVIVIYNHSITCNCVKAFQSQKVFS